MHLFWYKSELHCLQVEFRGWSASAVCIGRTHSPHTDNNYCFLETIIEHEKQDNVAVHVTSKLELLDNGPTGLTTHHLQTLLFFDKLDTP